MLLPEKYPPIVPTPLAYFPLSQPSLGASMCSCCCSSFIVVCSCSYWNSNKLSRGLFCISCFRSHNLSITSSFSRLCYLWPPLPRLSMQRPSQMHRTKATRVHVWSTILGLARFYSAARCVSAVGLKRLRAQISKKRATQQLSYARKGKNVDAGSYTGSHRAPSTI